MKFNKEMNKTTKIMLYQNISLTFGSNIEHNRT